MRDEQYVTRHIPANFESGITVIGMSFNIRFMIEGGLLGILGGLGSYLYLTSVEAADSGTIIGISIAIGAILLVFGLKGINDEPISLFLMHLLKFSREKQTAYYNPRVKTEAKPSIIGEQETLPREKLDGFILTLKEKLKDQSAKRAENITESETKDEIIVFSDDLAYIEANKPKKERGRRAKKKGERA